MKKYILFSLSLIAFAYTNIYAVPARPTPIILNQPDGTQLTIYLKGDEHLSLYQTLDGYLILRNSNNIFEYANISEFGEIKTTGIKVRNISERDLNEREYVRSLKKEKIYAQLLKNKSHTDSIVSSSSQIDKLSTMATSQPSISANGTKKLLCILIGYSDLAFSKTQSDFHNLMNQTGYNTGNAKGSVKDFFLENSYGQLSLDVTVIGPFSADHNMSYYGANSGSQNYVRADELIKEALEKANSNVNYNDYDNDGDGIVDGVHIIFAGYDESDGGSTDAMWSHKGSIYGFLGLPYKLDGIQILNYSCSSELRGNSGNNICGIGTVCHEIGHVLGAPDFYDINYSTDGQYDGTGEWDLMASGSWNDDSDSPANFNPYTKTQTFQWATLINLPKKNSFVTLYPANLSNNTFYKIPTPTSGEYFIIENRQRLGFDSGLPWRGMMIWHVHSLIESDRRAINTSHPQRLYPICASASTNPTSSPLSYGNINSAVCPFPGAINKTDIHFGSTPSLCSWAGESTFYDLKYISASGNNITFVVNPEISGSTFICNQATYSLILPQGATVNWIGSRALSIVSGQGTNSVVCQKTMFAITGSTLILRAIITFPTGQTMELTKNIFVGTYPPAILLCPATDIPPFAPHVEFGYTNENYYLFAHGENMSNNASDYLWRFYPLNTFELPQQSTGRYVAYSKSTPGEYKVSVQYNGECGWSPEVFRNIRFEDNLNVNLYPNPTSYILTAELTSNQAKSSVNSLTSNTNFDPYTIQLWNEYQGHVCSFEIIESKQQLSLQGLPSGMYIALIIKDGKTHQRKIVWKN